MVFPYLQQVSPPECPFEVVTVYECLPYPLVHTRYHHVGYPVRTFPLPVRVGSVVVVRRLEPLLLSTFLPTYCVTQRLPVSRQVPVPVIVGTEVPSLTYLPLVDPFCPYARLPTSWFGLLPVVESVTPLSLLVQLFPLVPFFFFVPDRFRRKTGLLFFVLW